ncbi:hypothetical protein PG993_005717 [Apiospora rasikravindrae]|uniref:Uncharacterized protein n=1 Tax=Apiospora rasikravindrae TaxID=990691 RepID=A0ABR1T9L2_9PEZI
MSSNNTTIPDPCWSTCNDAYLEAQRLGKGPQLCLADSPFQQTLSACRDCLQAHGSNTTVLASEPNFQQFIDSCSATSAAVNVPAPVTTWAGTAPSTIVTTENSVTVVRSTLVTTNVVYSIEVDGQTTLVTEQHVYPSYAPIPAITVITTTAVLADGRRTTWTDTITYSQLERGPSDNTNTASTTASDTPSISKTSPPPESPQTTAHNMAWVAGPAVGGVAAVVILAVLGFWWRRRGRQHRDRAIANGTTQELDGKEKLELAGSGPGVKLQGNTIGQPAQELEARGPYRNESADVHDRGVHEVERA